jgi:hypothetical protein
MFRSAASRPAAQSAQPEESSPMSSVGEAAVEVANFHRPRSTSADDSVTYPECRHLKDGRSLAGPIHRGVGRCAERSLGRVDQCGQGLVTTPVYENDTERRIGTCSRIASSSSSVRAPNGYANEVIGKPSARITSIEGSTSSDR